MRRLSRLTPKKESLGVVRKTVSLTAVGLVLTCSNNPMVEPPAQKPKTEKVPEKKKPSKKEKPKMNINICPSLTMHSIETNAIRRSIQNKIQDNAKPLMGAVSNSESSFVTVKISIHVDQNCKATVHDVVAECFDSGCKKARIGKKKVLTITGDLEIDGKVLCNSTSNQPPCWMMIKNIVRPQ